MRFKSSLSAMILALLGLTSAQAAIVPSLQVGSPTPVSGGLQYSYTGTVAGDQTMRVGDFLTVYDLVGLDTTSIVVDPGFTFSTQLLGINPGDPANPNLPDNGGIYNLTIKKTTAPLPGLATFNFSLVATGTPASRFYAGQGSLTSTSEGAVNFAKVSGPGVAAVPEPSVTALLGVAGLLGLGCRAIRRGRATT